MLIRGGTVVSPEHPKPLENCDVLTVGETITEVSPNGEKGRRVEFGEPVIDAHNMYVCPGFVDIHTHGALGVSFDHAEGSHDGNALSKSYARHGVTSFLPTLASGPLRTTSNRIAQITNWMWEEAPGARILGVHLEGPYLAPAQRGAHSTEYLRQPLDDSGEWMWMVKPGVKMVTLAPELPGGLDLVAFLSVRGIKISVGHSEASGEVLSLAVRKGVTHAAHLWSGQSALRRQGPWRVPGLLEEVLVEGTLTGEVIADGKHLPPTLLRLAVLCLGVDRLCLVSDSTFGAGLPEGTRFSIAGTQAVVANGVAMVDAGDSFAGSTTMLDGMIRVAVAEVGLDLADAIRMATRTPARAIGIHNIGTLSAGARADVAILDGELRVVMTIVGGRLVYSRE